MLGSLSLCYASSHHHSNLKLPHHLFQSLKVVQLLPSRWLFFVCFSLNGFHSNSLRFYIRYVVVRFALPMPNLTGFPQVFITLTMAIARIGPVVFPDHNNTGAVEEKTWAMMISRIARAAQVMEGECKPAQLRMILKWLIRVFQSTTVSKGNLLLCEDL